LKKFGGILGAGLLIWGLLMARACPLLPMRARILNGMDLTEHGSMGAGSTVIVVHSIFQGRESSWPMAQALARRGLNTVNLHLRGGLDYGEYVRGIGQVVGDYAARGPVYLWGHSMGADLVADAASQDSRVQGTVAAGFPVTSSSPRLLLVVGAWDQLHSIPEMRKAAEALPGHPRTVVLWLADHSQENFDLESARLAAAQFGGDSSHGWSDAYLARGLISWGLILLTWACYSGRLRLIALLLAAVCWWGDPFHTVARALVLGLAVAQGSASLLDRRQTLSLVAALGLGTLLVAWPNWTEQPGLVGWLPLALLCWLPTGLMKFAADVPPWGWVGLGILEVVRPGALLALVCWLPRTSWRKLGQLSLDGPRRVTPSQVGLLALLLVGAGLAWRNVVEAGYWPDSEQWKVLIGKVGGLVVTPLLVWTLAARGFSRRAAQPDP
jgi:hypothetical protein